MIGRLKQPTAFMSVIERSGPRGVTSAPVELSLFQAKSVLTPEKKNRACALRLNVDVLGFYLIDDVMNVLVANA